MAMEKLGVRPRTSLQLLHEQIRSLCNRVARPQVKPVRPLARDVRAHAHAAYALRPCPRLRLGYEARADPGAALGGGDDEAHDLRVRIVLERAAERDVYPADGAVVVADCDEEALVVDGCPRKKICSFGYKCTTVGLQAYVGVSVGAGVVTGCKCGADLPDIDTLQLGPLLINNHCLGEERTPITRVLDSSRSLVRYALQPSRWLAGKRHGRQPNEGYTSRHRGFDASAYY